MENIVTVPTPTGYWQGTGSGTQLDFAKTTAPGWCDRHFDGGVASAATMKNVMDHTGFDGTHVRDQFFRFSCARCGIAEDKIAGPKVRASGFRITTTMSKDKDKDGNYRYYFHTKKEGKANNDVDAGGVDDTGVKDAEVKD